MYLSDLTSIINNIITLQRLTFKIVNKQLPPPAPIIPPQPHYNPIPNHPEPQNRNSKQQPPLPFPHFPSSSSQSLPICPSSFSAAGLYIHSFCRNPLHPRQKQSQMLTYKGMGKFNVIKEIMHIMCPHCNKKLTSTNIGFLRCIAKIEGDRDGIQNNSVQKFEDDRYRTYWGKNGIDFMEFSFLDVDVFPIGTNPQKYEDMSKQSRQKSASFPSRQKQLYQKRCPQLPQPLQGTCSICLTEPSNMIVQSCLHLCMCRKCATQMQDKDMNYCPICKKMGKFNKVFIS